MKNIFLIILLIACLPLSMFGKGDGMGSDVLYIGKQKYRLCNLHPQSKEFDMLKELVSDSMKYIYDQTDDGFIWYWSIKKRELYLDSIACYLGRRTSDDNSGKPIYESLNQDKVFNVFKKYVKGRKINATWVNDTLHIARGSRLSNVYEWNYEEEVFLNVENGKVKGKTEYHNRVYYLDKSIFRYQSIEEIDDYWYNAMRELKEIPELQDNRVDCHIKINMTDTSLVAPKGYATIERATFPDDFPENKKKEVLATLENWVRKYYQEIYWINGKCYPAERHSTFGPYNN